jgi:hypothetical protein
MAATTLQEVADRILIETKATTLRIFIADARDDDRSFEWIARELASLTNVGVASRTVRRWCEDFEDEVSA